MSERSTSRNSSTYRSNLNNLTNKQILRLINNNATQKRNLYQEEYLLEYSIKKSLKNSNNKTSKKLMPMKFRDKLRKRNERKRKSIAKSKKKI